MFLSETERREIGERAARFEARTGVQVAAAVVGRCDTYPEIPWKAFALFSGLTFFAAMGREPDVFMGGLSFFLGGATAALATVFLPSFARLFLNSARRKAETRQYAASFLLDHDLTRSWRHHGILVLVGVFERAVVILPDAGLRGRLENVELKHIIRRMAPQLAGGRFAAALLDGLDALEALLADKGFAGDGGNEAAREVFEEKGE
jgi:putative membrane protein